MEDIFKNSFIEVELTSPKEFRRYKFIKVSKIVNQNYAYFVHCKRTQNNYYAYLIYFGDNLHLRWESCVESKWKLLSNVQIKQCDLIHYNIYIAVIQRDIYPTLSYRCDFEYLPYAFKELYRKYIIYKYDKYYWKKYCEELDENENKNINYPITKISHMREIVDLIGSFL